MLNLILALVIVGSMAIPKIQSRYECSGVTPSGPYQYGLTIEQKGNNYFLSWENGAMVGLGIREENQLAVAFVNLHNNAVGVVLYEVKEGQLIGLWTGGDGVIYKEDCLVGRQASKELGYGYSNITRRASMARIVQLL